MKTVFGALFIICNSFASLAHEYFFSFAEMEYNDITRKFEVTIIATTHDLEKYFEKEKSENINLTVFEAESRTTLLISRYFEDHFQLKTEKTNCRFMLIGFESSLNGITNFYFESEPIDITPSITITNTVLMDEYPQQQNKITFYYRSKSHTTDFLRNDYVKTIRLD